MLHVITGLNGAGKSFYTVDMLLKISKENIKGLKANPDIYQKNSEIIELHNYMTVDLNPEDFAGDQPMFVNLRTTYEKFMGASITLEEIFDLLPDHTIFAGQFSDIYYKNSIYYNFFVPIINKQLDLKLKPILPVRQIYTDISGLNIPDVLRSPEDWRETPEGSIVVYDEAQKKDMFKSKGRETISNNPILAGFETHRHSAHDIYFITQDAKFLHKHILSLIGHHINITRPMGTKFPIVYEWSHHQPSPESITSKKRADGHKNFQLKQEIFKYYKSTVSNTHNFEWKKLLKLAAMPIIAVFAIGFLLFGSNNSFLNTHIFSDAEKASKGELSNANNPQQPNTANSSAPTTGVTSFNGAPVQAYQPPQPSIYEQESKRIAFVSKSDTYCRAFDGNGNLMMDVQLPECQYLADNPIALRRGLRENTEQPTYQQPQSANSTASPPVAAPFGQPASGQVQTQPLYPNSPA